MIKVKSIALSIYIVILIITYFVTSIITIYFVVLIIFLKITTSNNIIVYETSTKIQHKLQNIAKVFFIIWKNNNDIVDSLKKNWILIKIIILKQNWNRHVFILLNLKIVILLTRNSINYIVKKNELNNENHIFLIFWFSSFEKRYIC